MQPTYDLMAAIKDHPQLQRIAGGYQTDVYGSAEHHYVIKLKNGQPATRAAVLAQLHEQRLIAERFANWVGPDYSIPSWYMIAGDDALHAQGLVIQPLVRDALPLKQIELERLPTHERIWLAARLRDLMRRALACYWHTSVIPDLDGVPVMNEAERQRYAKPYLAPLHVWNWFVNDTLLRSYNLLLQREPLRLTLVDYDLVHQRWLIRRLYYAIRALVFVRDWWLVRKLQSHHEDM